ncbi:helix-turn-helix domain-containing protein [Mycobacteroides chelonae]|uniref:helix-turn-helix domain-containing protein n=1 Tax=Mycobacteroides chelonae TaxID=1774 RepID=UPI0008A9B0B4|nr:helix-turn-helix domain-containing protein [Mycobacteroides chelonae]MBF9319834.1 helix-turn-helix domain-containing protein [Mycobacteroides chelonae]OHT73656.1 hypothetical protein BKG66_05070 [Mycobacteroides chelonae]OHT76213.1 hypothetical protein BKG67_01910 [Mycobacteroides chelonae]
MSSPTTTLERPTLVPTKHASVHTGIPVYRLQALTHQGMPCVHIGRKLYFNLDEVDAWIGQNLTTGARATPCGDPDWVAAQVAKFSPDDLRRAGELLLALASSAPNSASVA